MLEHSKCTFMGIFFISAACPIYKKKKKNPGQTNWMVRAVGANVAVYFCFNVLYTGGGDQ